MKKVLVTGGLGYLGGRVSAALRSAGHEVLVGTRKRDSSTAECGYPVTTFDLADSDETRSALGAAGVGAIVHLAATNEAESSGDPRRAYEINCTGTWNLLDAAARAGVKELLYISTFHVYGDAEGRITEDTATRPAHPYATTHRAAEDIARYFARYRGLSTATYRLSNGFGAPALPYLNGWTLVFNDFCRQYVTTGELRLLSAGDQVCDFTTLEDVGRAVVHALDTPGIIDRGDVLNLGGRRLMSIRDVAAAVARVAEQEDGVEVPVIVPDAPPSKPRSFEYDMSKLEATGFKLAGSMEKEISNTIAVCRRLQQALS